MCSLILGQENAALTNEISAQTEMTAVAPLCFLPYKDTEESVYTLRFLPVAVSTSPLILGSPVSGIMSNKYLLLVNYLA